MKKKAKAQKKRRHWGWRVERGSVKKTNPKKGRLPVPERSSLSCTGISLWQRAKGAFEKTTHRKETHPTPARRERDNSKQANKKRAGRKNMSIVSKKKKSLSILRKKLKLILTAAREVSLGEVRKSRQNPRNHSNRQSCSGSATDCPANERASWRQGILMLVFLPREK